MTQKKDIGKILRQFGLVFVALFIIVFMSIKSDCISDKSEYH